MASIADYNEFMSSIAKYDIGNEKAVKLTMPDSSQVPEVRLTEEDHLKIKNSQYVGMKHDFINVSITRTKGRLDQSTSGSSVSQKIVEEVSGMEINFHSAREINYGKPAVRVLTSGVLTDDPNYMDSTIEYKSNQSFKQVEYKTIGQVEAKNGERTFFETGIKLTGYQNTTSFKQYSEANPLVIKADEFKKEDAKDLEFLFDIKDENAVFPESGVGYIKWIDDLKESLGVEGSSANPEEVLSFGNYYENLFTSKFNYLEVSEDGSFTSYDVSFTYFSSHEQNSYSADSQRWIS